MMKHLVDAYAPAELTGTKRRRPSWERTESGGPIVEGGGEQAVGNPKPVQIR